MVWLIILVASFSVSRAVLRLMRARRNRLADTSAPARPLVCPVCGYNLFGITSAQCPECGHVVPLERPTAANPDQERRMAAARIKVAEAYARRNRPAGERTDD